MIVLTFCSSNKSVTKLHHHNDSVFYIYQAAKATIYITDFEPITLGMLGKVSNGLWALHKKYA